MRMLIRKSLCLAAIVLLCQLLSVPQTRTTKPLLAVIYAEWCPMCQQLKPVLALIGERYNGKIELVRLDMTSEKTAAEAKLKAHNAGVESFFNENKERTSLVIIQDASGKEIFRAYHDYDFDHYAKVLDQQLQAPRKIKVPL